MARVDTELVSKVQFNCDLSDARYAGNYTMCIYLLKMREFYRWHHGLSYGDALSMPSVSEWVRRLEDRWDAIESRPWEPVPVDGVGFDVFDADAINDRLAGRDVVFSSGIGRFGKPVFFLADCIKSREQGGLKIFVTGHEYARELSAPPAMIRGRRIFLRRQSIERMLWEAIEEWRWHRREGPMEKVHAHYGFDRDADAALAALVDDHLEQLLLHEQGEYQAGVLLAGDWNAMLVDVASTRAENVARAVRDCLADSLAVVPQLVRDGRSELVHLYFAMRSPLARDLFPALTRDYRNWLDGGTIDALAGTARAATEHFVGVCNEMLARHESGLPAVGAGADAHRSMAFHGT